MSFILLNKAVQAIPMGTGYAVWTGIGAVGTVIIGILFFREPVDLWRVFFIFLLIGSILGLKFISHS
jgi:quaternary ammonium compound-resistance protein SugE